MNRVKLSEEKNKLLEIICIVALILIGLISYFFNNFIFKNGKDNIVVFVNGNQIEEIDGKKIDINIDGTYTIGDINSEYNIIEIKDKKVRCIDANCPDKICMQHGALRSDIDNDMIVCAPHKLVIQYK